MKIDYNNTVVKTDVTATAIHLGIDLSGMNHVMSILSNLYSDAPLAVVREYSTNARDSHIAAGISLPIEVISPTPLMPQLTVIDHGLGMSEQDILATYSKYGSSTKRNSNDQVGAFGIGAKSAFTIASQFTVTGVQDGRKTVVLFSLQEDHTPVLQILHQSETTEGNGVKVTVPISDVDGMNETIQNFFYTWRPGTVVVDGKEPKNLWSDPLAVDLGAGIFLRIADPQVESWRRSTKMSLVMGSVPYEVSSTDAFPIRRHVHNGAHVYVEVPVGSVDIAPSREALKDTPRTVSVLKTAQQDFIAALDSTENADIARTTDPLAAVRKSRKWGDLRGVGDNNGGLTWRAQNAKWNLADIQPHEMLDLNFADLKALHPENYKRYLVITGCDTPRKVKLIQNRRGKWTKARGESSLIVVPSATYQGRFGWFAYGPSFKTPTVDYKTFKAEAAALYRKASSTGRMPGEISYSYRQGSESAEGTPDEIRALVEDEGATLVLVAKDEYVISSLDDEYVQVCMEGRQRLEVAAKRIGLPYKTITEVKQELQKAVIATVTVDEWRAMAAHSVCDYTTTKLFDALDSTRITNPRLKNFLERHNAYDKLDSQKYGLPIPDNYKKVAAQELLWIRAEWPLLKNISIPYNPHKGFVTAVEGYLNAQLDVHQV